LEVTYAMSLATMATQNLDPFTLVLGAIVAAVLGIVIVVKVVVKGVLKAIASALTALRGVVGHSFADGFASVFRLPFLEANAAERQAAGWDSMMNDLARCYAELGPPSAGAVQ
jgi:hypothetical protein